MERNIDNALVVGLLQPPVYTFLQAVLDRLRHGVYDKVAADLHHVFWVAHPGQRRTERNNVDVSVSP